MSFVEFIDPIDRGVETLRSELDRLGVPSALIRQDAFQRHVPGIGQTGVRRIYLTSHDDYPKVREALGDTFPIRR